MAQHQAQVDRKLRPRLHLGAQSDPNEETQPTNAKYSQDHQNADVRGQGRALLALKPIVPGKPELALRAERARVARSAVSLRIVISSRNVAIAIWVRGAETGFREEAG